MKKSSNVICAACTACEATMSAMPNRMAPGATACDADPSPASRLEAPTSAMPAMQHPIPR